MATNSDDGGRADAAPGRWKRAGRVSVLLASALWHTAHCPAAAAQDATDKISIVKEIAYRSGVSKSCTLDLAMPCERRGAPRPAIVVIHGGGWVEGDKSSFTTATAGVPGNIGDFAQLGFVAATINYRLAGEAPFPAALEDCQYAVRYLRAHADEYQIDESRIGAFGNSAGGHLALLLGRGDAVPEPAGDDPTAQRSSRVQAVVSDSGPLDLVRQHEQNQLRTVVERFLGGPPTGARLADYRRASPARVSGEHLPPLLLIYGENDEQVDVRTADDFVTALARAGHKEISYLRLAGVGHCPYSIARVGYLRDAVNEFFERTLSRPEKP